mgnify:CR=1 FL=1
MSDRLSALQLYDFTEQVTSKSPTPGGGGVAALIGALATALGAMAANLTMGKKNFLPYEEDHRYILAETSILRLRFLELIDEDAAAFEPLSRAYSMDRADPAYADTIRNCTLAAAAAPFEMIQCCGKLIVLLEDLKEKCSALLLSDVGCAAAAAGAALECAFMNVLVNTRLLPGDPEAETLSAQTEEMLSQYLPRAQAVADAVFDHLRRHV